MIRAGLALAAVLWSSAAAANFRPVEDRPYRYETVETRSGSGVTRRFRASRTVIFHKTATGYDATVTLDAVDAQAGGEVGAMFRTATGALLHRPLRYHLDVSGAIVGIDDADAAVALIADAIERSSAHNERSGDARVLASPLRALPPERKAAMLGSILTPLIGGPTADRTPGARPITLPSRPPLAPGTALAGVETLTRGASGIITIDVQASGGVDTAAPPGTPGSRIAAPVASPSITIQTLRNVDSATGLVIDSRDIAETRALHGDAAHTTRVETTVTLTLTPSS